MSKLQSDKTQDISVEIKQISDYRDILLLFGDLVSTLRGPGGKVSMLQNTNGGNLMLTSSSKLLFKGMSFTKAIIKLIVSASQSHLSAFHDGGLFLSGLSAGLIVHGIEKDLNSVLLSDIFEAILTVLMDYLNSPECFLKLKACMNDLNFISSFVHTILKSKQLCQLNGENIRHISHLLIECFLTNISETATPGLDGVFIQCQEGFSVTESFTREGILLLAPETSRFREKKLTLRHSKKEEKLMIKVAIVVVSMSGDMEELSGVNYTVSGSVDFDGAVVDRLNRFCDFLIGQDVGLVLCQKVVHPELKYRLKEEGVLVVERIGNQPISYLKSLTEASPIQCLDPSVSLKSAFGWLDRVSHSIVHGKSYLLLQRQDCPVTSLYICHYQEEHLNELKDVCSTALVSLGHLLYEPYVLPGAGCWQTMLSCYLKKKIWSDLTDLCEELGCTQNTVKEVCDLFIKCLIKAGIGKLNKYSVNITNGHLYLRNEVEDECQQNLCCCGLEERTSNDLFIDLELFYSRQIERSFKIESSTVDFAREISQEYMLDKIKSREIILDSYIMCKGALQTAVLTAISALRIGQVVEDVS